MLIYNPFYSYYKQILQVEFFLSFDKVSSYFDLLKLKKITFVFFLTDLKTAEDVKLINFLQYMDSFFQIKKKPYITKIFVSNKKFYKICIKYTFNQNFGLFILENVISKINILPTLEKKNSIFLSYSLLNNYLKVLVKKFSLFENLEALDKNYILPKVNGNIFVYFQNKQDIYKHLQQIFDLDHNLSIKLIK